MLPNVIFHTTISKMKSSEFYLFAKMGNVFAAENLVQSLIKPNKLNQIIELAIESNAVIAPVYGIERLGTNKIPIAYAGYIAKLSQLKVANIFQSKKVFHTGDTAINRLLTKPQFIGPVYPMNYIIFDDVITSGSTVMALKYYIESKGGKVVLVSSISTAFSPQTGHSSVLEITPKTYQILNEKFKINELKDLLLQYEIIHKDIAEISNSQAKYLSTFSGIDSIRAALIKA